jgi:hypothetical protein
LYLAVLPKYGGFAKLCLEEREDVTQVMYKCDLCISSATI